MDVLTFSETRANLKSVMDQVVNDHSPVVVARKRGEAVVIVSLDDWNAMEATHYLLSNPANAEMLRQSIAELDAGGGVEHELIYP
ncbi:type II toxin-antitoxin system prevent-host-death family antitoxin [soil metagenome]